MNFNTFVVTATKQLVAQNRLPFSTEVPRGYVPTEETRRALVEAEARELVRDLRGALAELAARGGVSEGHRPHALDNPGGNYNGCIDYHIGGDEVDVAVLHIPHGSNPVIRLVRIGGHDKLFRGPMR